MMEYVFFDNGLRSRFVDFARGLGVTCSESNDGMGMIAAVPEDVAEDVGQALEACYDRLMEEQADLVDQSEGGLKKHVVGIRATLADGRQCMIPLEPALANRLLACLGLDEVEALVNAVARALENPSAGPLCRA